MTTYQIDLLNPEAAKLLQDLADLQLIAIRQVRTDEFQTVIDALRDKAADSPLSLEEITKEVEAVRAARYANANTDG